MLNKFTMQYLNYEVGYVALNKFLFFIGLNKREFLIVIATIIQIPIFFTMYKYSEQPLTSVLWYFSFGNFLFTFSGLRQSIAMAICFFAYRFIREKKFINYIISIILASGFHSSALFCLILYPLYYLNLNQKKVFIALGVLFVVFMLRGPIFMVLSKFYYGKSSETSSTGAYTMFLVFVCMFIVSVLNSNTDQFRDYVGLRNILLALAIVYSFASMHDFVVRIGYPLSLYMSLFVPKIIDGFNVRPKVLYRGICYSTLLLAFFYFLGSLNTLPFSFG